MGESVETEKMLNALLEKNYDAQRGYATAAEDVKHVQLKRWFAKQGKVRTQFCAELAGEMKRMNMEPNNDGSVLGDLHRQWMDIKSFLSLNTQESILEECLRGEQASLDEYNDVLEHRGELAPTIVTILENQRHTIQMTIAKENSLEAIADEKDV